MHIHEPLTKILNSEHLNKQARKASVTIFSKNIVMIINRHKSSYGNLIITLSYDRIDSYQHYANISIGPSYEIPRVKTTVSQVNLEFLEYSVFNILDKLKPTATGLDGLPVWFMRVASSWIASSVSHIFNLSYRTSTIPYHWYHTTAMKIFRAERRYSIRYRYRYSSGRQTGSHVQAM